LVYDLNQRQIQTLPYCLCSFARITGKSLVFVVAGEAKSHATINMHPSVKGASERWNIMSRNALYFLIGLLVVALVVAGYLYYQESRSGIDIQIGEDGIKIDGN
jgi:hypothetical protein